MKMHLTARASNEGARQVARWVAKDFGGDVDRAAEKVWIMGMGLQRIIAGEITPGRDLGVRLHKACGVTAGMFNRAPSAGWFDDAPRARAA